MEKHPYILVADDDFEDRSIMNECFKFLGHNDAVRFLEDGISLIEYLSAADNEPASLIVLDLNMPKINGTETLRLIRNIPAASNIPVVIFSTSLNEIEKRNCMKLGAKEYITKPSKWETYVEACRNFFNMSVNGLPATNQ
jgi:CheY-like chemotaxis protein